MELFIRNPDEQFPKGPRNANKLNLMKKCDPLGSGFIRITNSTDLGRLTSFKLTLRVKGW